VAESGFAACHVGLAPDNAPRVCRHQGPAARATYPVSLCCAACCVASFWTLNSAIPAAGHHHHLAFLHLAFCGQHSVCNIAAAVRLLLQRDCCRRAAARCRECNGCMCLCHRVFPPSFLQCSTLYVCSPVPFPGQVHTALLRMHFTGRSSQGLSWCLLCLSCLPAGQSNTMQRTQ
jgi:hypothetical protein